MDIQKIEKQLWAAADKLRGNISPSVYKYVVLRLIFLKYVSCALETQRQKIAAFREMNAWKIGVE